MLTQKAVISQLKKLASEMKLSGIHLTNVVLYGSYSRNKQTEWSDIDVAFVADEFIGIGFEDVKLFARTLVNRSEMNIQPRTYNTKDFTPDSDPFVEEILRTGIEIAG